MEKNYIIPIAKEKINGLYNLWFNNGFDNEDNVDVDKILLRGSEKNINQINLYSIERDSEFLSSVILIFPKDNPTISGLGEVCTRIDSRGRNYASSLCKLARDDFFSKSNAEGNFLGTVNPVAAKIYEKLGWKKITNSLVMFNSVNNISFDNFVEQNYISSEKLNISEGSPYFRLPLIPFVLSNKKFIYSDINVGILGELESSYCLSLYDKFDSLLKRNGNWYCMHNLNNQIYGISTYQEEKPKIYRIDGFNNHIYKNDFHNLLDKTIKSILEKDPLKIYVDVLMDDKYKYETFSELNFFQDSKVTHKIDNNCEKEFYRMILDFK